jgi:competence/damage-inducible protein CinA-like protein
MPAAEIITIGTELLLGETVDTNTRFIARVLRGLGIDLFRSQTIGDNAGRIAETIRQALERADIVITTGGLGPTVDDPTRQAIADSVGVALKFHPELWEQITARIASYGRTPTENQKRQAYIPENAIVIENPVGTAPAFIVERSLLPAGAASGTRTGVIVSLPGVPREMETLLTDAVIPYLQKHFDLHAVLKIRTLHVSGLGEGVIDDQIGDLETLANPTVGLTAHSGVVDIRIAAKAMTETEASRMIETIEQDLRTRLGDNIFGSDEDTLETAALNIMAQRGWTLATVESGLDDALMTRLNRTGHPAYRGGRSREVHRDSLVKTTETLIQEMNASVVLGLILSVSMGKQEISIVIITPRGKEEKHLSYGGHPANAKRWAVNMALDWLRRSLQGAG